MPKSKTRKPVRTVPPRAVPRVTTPESSLEVATLALTQAALEIVRESEVHIREAVRNGEGVDEALEVHHALRSGTLGFLVAYSQLAGLPDPREGRG